MFNIFIDSHCYVCVKYLQWFSEKRTFIYDDCFFFFKKRILATELLRARRCVWERNFLFLSLFLSQIRAHMNVYKWRKVYLKWNAVFTDKVEKLLNTRFVRLRTCYLFSPFWAMNAFSSTSLYIPTFPQYTRYAWNVLSKWGRQHCPGRDRPRKLQQCFSNTEPRIRRGFWKTLSNNQKPV